MRLYLVKYNIYGIIRLMKISDIAKKLGVSIKEVRDKAKELGFVIAQKSNTMGDKKAKEFIEMAQKDTILNAETVEKSKEEEKKRKMDETKDERG